MGARRAHLILVPVAISLVLVGAAMTFGSVRATGLLPDCPAQRPIVLDPGHGGIDGGANVPGLLEKDIVLDVALRTRAYLEARSVPVVLTRTTDTDLGGPNDVNRLRRDLNQRIRIANHCNALLMLSIHVNSATDTTERGALIFYQQSRASRDAAFVFDHVLRTWPVHERQERPHPHGSFAVLRWPKAPAVLVEVGFISNATDRATLADATYRDQVARALARACEQIYQNWMQ